MTEDFLSNSAAVPLAELAVDEARVALEPLQQRRSALHDVLSKTQINDDEDLRRAADKIALSVALREEAERRLDPIRTPYADAGIAVRNVQQNFSSDLSVAEREVQGKINAFRARQREAAALRANEQRAREAELRRKAGLDQTPAAAPVKASDVKLQSARSDFGAQVFDRKVITVSIVDPRALPDTILKSPGVIEAMEKAVRKMASLTRDIPGAKIDDGLTSNVKVK